MVFETQNLILSTVLSITFMQCCKIVLMFYNVPRVCVGRIIKRKYMNEDEIRDEARKAANRSQFLSNHIYDHKSYEDGFYEGMTQALRTQDVGISTDY
jgi:hypothetical protein